jgi:hypothetical protein
MMGSNRSVSRLLASGLLVAGVACGSDGPTARGLGPPALVRIVPNPVTVLVSGSIQLAAVVQDASGRTIPGVPVSWSVADSATATVTPAGRLTGRAVGSTTVTAAAGAVSGQAAVTVTAVSPTTLHPDLVTYLGGALLDVARDVSGDAAGNVVLGGSTESPNFPTTQGSYDPTFNTGGTNLMDGWLVKLTPGGSEAWGTFLGGPNFERIYALELDAQGAVYVAGRAGAGFPVTAGAFQTAFAGGPPSPAYGQQDGFVCKMAADGASRVWCSYFGVADGGILRDIAVDANGDVYVAGGTSLGGFPAAWFSNAYQPAKKAGEDVIVAKIKGDGSQVLWATYLGGSGDEGAGPVVRVDPQGNVIVLTTTTSTDLPTVNAAQPSPGGGSDLYLFKLDPTGHALIYATYLGGSGTEGNETHELAVDAQGNAVVAIGSTSTNIATTAGAYQPSFGGGPRDIVVWKISPAGAKLACTYLGGSGAEGGVEGVATDPLGNVYLAVTSSSTNYPVTAPGAPARGFDAIPTVLSADLTQLLFAQRFGGSGDEQTRSAAVDSQGRFYVVGQTPSTDLGTLNAPQPGFGGGGSDAFLIRLVP